MENLKGLSLHFSLCEKINLKFLKILYASVGGVRAL